VNLGHTLSPDHSDKIANLALTEKLGLRAAIARLFPAKERTGNPRQLTDLVMTDFLH
jgi:hypothetical protein